MLGAALTSFGRQRLAVGDLRRARVLLEEPRKTAKHREELLLGLAELARAEGRTGDCARLPLEAVQESRRTVNLGTQAEAWIERALALLQLSSPSAAEDALGQAVPRVSRWPDPRLQLRLSEVESRIRKESAHGFGTLAESREVAEVTRLAVRCGNAMEDAARRRCDHAGAPNGSVGGSKPAANIYGSSRLLLRDSSSL